MLLQVVSFGGYQDAYSRIETGRYASETSGQEAIPCRGMGKQGEDIMDEPVDNKPSESLCRVVKRISQLTVVDLCLETRRKHQLRVHLSRLGHSIVGDKRYRGYRPIPACERLCLWAQKLGMDHLRDWKVAFRMISGTSKCYT